MPALIKLALSLASDAVLTAKQRASSINPLSYLSFSRCEKQLCLCVYWSLVCFSRGNWHLWRINCAWVRACVLCVCMFSEWMSAYTSTHVAFANSQMRSDLKTKQNKKLISINTKNCCSYIYNQENWSLLNNAFSLSICLTVKAKKWG